jgi:regulator of protease activity HflC (stomatin/prohibitin superfamily)
MITTILLLAIIIVTFIVVRSNWENYFVDHELSLGRLSKPIGIMVLFIIGAVAQPYSMSRIDSGHVGIKAALIGKDRGVGKYEYVTGYVLVNSWIEQLFEFPIYQQHIEYPEQVVITKGGFQTTIKPSFNYNLVAGNIGDMFVNLRVPLKTVEQQWLLTAIIGSVNDVANLWTVDDIFNHREKFESAIIMEAKKRTGKWFNLSQLRTNINPPDALKASILAKTRAIQEVQVAEMAQKVAVAEALTNVAKATGLANAKIAEARGDSASIIINAKAEAQAMSLKQQQATPTYVEFIKWSRWDGKLPTTTLGSGANILWQK